MGGFGEAKIAPKSILDVLFNGTFFEHVFELFFRCFLEWRHAFRLAVAQSKRMSAILDDGPKNIKKLLNFEG